MKLNDLICCFRLIGYANANDFLQDLPYSVHNIESSPGIYFEKLKPALFYDDNWRIITHLDIQSFQEKLNLIDNIYNKIIHLCENSVYKNYSSCSNNLKIISQIIPTLHSKNNYFKQIIGHYRTKRGWFNGVGTVFKTLIGTMDQNDAEYYDKAIDHINLDEKHLISLLHEQTQIVNSAIKNFNETVSSLNNNEATINYNFELFKNYSVTNDKHLFQLEIRQRLEEQVALLNIMTIQVDQQFGTLINTVLFARSNILHPFILSPEQLINELISTLKYVPSSRTYPFELNINNAVEIMQSCKLTVFYSNFKLIFVISIPLVSPTHFTLYKLIPLPMKANTGNFLFISPNYKYIFLTDNKESYIMSNDISDCINL